MEERLKWRIVESSDKRMFFVQKKYFNKIWYSFDWKTFGEDFFGLLITTFFISGIISGILNLLIENFSFKISFLVLEVVFSIIFAFGNSLSFNSYNEAENYIKDKIKRKIHSNITEITWDGKDISIEKKKE